MSPDLTNKIRIMKGTANYNSECRNPIEKPNEFIIDELKIKQ